MDYNDKTIKEDVKTLFALWAVGLWDGKRLHRDCTRVRYGDGQGVAYVIGAGEPGQFVWSRTVRGKHRFERYCDKLVQMIAAAGLRVTEVS